MVCEVILISANEKLGNYLIRERPENGGAIVAVGRAWGERRKVGGRGGPWSVNLGRDFGFLVPYMAVYSLYA